MMCRKRENFGILNEEDMENAPLFLYEGGIESRYQEEYSFQNDKRPDYHGYLFQYTLSGRGGFEKNGVYREMTAGQGFMVRFPEKSRYFLPLQAEEGWRFIYLHFDGAAADFFWNKIEQTGSGCFTLSKESQAIRMALQLHEKLMEGKQLLKYEGGEFLYSFLCALLEEIEYPGKCGKDDPVTAAIGMMQKEYGRIESIEEIAVRLGITKEHFSRCFTRKMNVTPLHYLTNIRLQAAMKDLLNTELPLETVACRNGFSGSNYFCKIFRKYVKETPAEYRRRNSGK